MNVVGSLAPVVLLVLLGVVLRRLRFVRPEFFRDSNRFAFWLALPALMIRELAGTSIREQHVGGAMIVLVSATAAAGLAAGLTRRAAGVGRASAGTYIMTSFRGNLAFVGLPVILYATPAGGAASAASAAAATLCLAPMMILFNVVSVFLLSPTDPRAAARGGGWVRPLATNPLILSCLAGIAIAWARIPLPPPLMRTLGALGATALPLGLLAIGAGLDFSRLKGAWRAPGWSAALKTLFAPAAGWLAARAIGLGPAETFIAIVFLSCPTAVNSYIMAQEMAGDEKLAGDAIVFSTVLSFFPLAAAVALFAPR
jgi:predicted permease